MAPALQWLLSAGMLAALSGSAIAKPVSNLDPNIRVGGPDEDQFKLAYDNVMKILNGSLTDGVTRPNCTAKNVAVRKEYGDLTNAERLDYTKAVNCLLKAPSKLSATKYPGAKNRYDDFVVVHMNMTPSVHGTANFLHWHRYFIYAYETALRNECGYKGYQPYWNWGKYADPNKSPIFNGDEFSISGNGEKVSHTSPLTGMNGMRVPAGPGGGCVKTGPFANMSVNLGPVMPMIDTKLGVPRNPRSDGFGYNPRCLRRDVSDFFTSKYIRPQDIADHIKGAKDLAAFQDSLQNDAASKFCLHTGGHYTIWGDPGGDVYVSPADPAFWLHHGMIDRHWWVWQNQDPATRVTQYKGGTVWMVPSSPAGKVDDIQNLDVVKPAADGPVSSKMLLSTSGGALCYIYA